MDRPPRRIYLLPLLALALLALPACSDSESQETGALTPVDPPVLLRVDDTPSLPSLDPVVPITPVVVPTALPVDDQNVQPTGGAAPVNPSQNPDWWQSYLAAGGNRSATGPELNGPTGDAFSPAPRERQFERLPTPTAPRSTAPPASSSFERLPPAPQYTPRYSPEDRTATPQEPVDVAMSMPPAMPASPREAFAASPAPARPRATEPPPAGEVELGMPTGAPLDAPTSERPSQSARPILPNYARPEYQAQTRPAQVQQVPRVETPQQAATQPAPAAAAPPVASAVTRPRVEDPMLPVNQRADELIAHGNSLAVRGAHYSARSDFVQALRLITQANDARLQTNRHSEALAAALRALRESDDFVPQGASVEADLNLAQIISVHRTPILRETSPESLTSLTCLQAYYTYAQEQFAVAAAGNPSASRAFYSLARLHSLLAEKKPVDGAVLGPKALALHQAALMTDPTNYSAANELGVLFARYGQLGQARTVLLHGLSVQPQPELWQNLATVYQRQGEAQLAERARQQAQLAAEQPSPAAEADPIRWVAPESFMGPPEGEAIAHPVPAAHTATPPAAPAAPRSARETNSFTDWLPWERSR